MRAGRPRAAVTGTLVFVLVLLAACGDDGEGGGQGATTTAATAAADQLDLQVASFDLAVGAPSRFIVGITTRDRRLLSFGAVPMRFSYRGTREQPVTGEPGPPLTGTFLPIPGTTLPTPAPTEPRVTNPSEARGVYATQVGFDRAGFWEVEALVSVNGGTRRLTAALAVNEDHAVPGVGDPALPTENLTLASTDAPRPAIDSREAAGGLTDPELHQTTIAAALAAKRPTVAVFATPVYCVSMFCGPVTDMVQSLAKTYGDRASFVHVEIWRDFQAEPPVLNKAAADWLFHDDDLNEPWVFVIGADGRITARFDNVTTQGELEPLLQQLPVIGPPK